jgi:hypothetical protein
MSEPSQVAAHVAKAAQSAWEVGAQLYGLYRDTRTSMVTLSSLATETMSLGNTCDALGNQLRKLSGQDLGPSEVRLLGSVDSQRADCNQYLNELGGAVRDMRPEITSAMSRVVGHRPAVQILSSAVRLTTDNSSTRYNLR